MSIYVFSSIMDTKRKVLAWSIDSSGGHSQNTPARRTGDLGLNLGSDENFSLKLKSWKNKK